VDARRRQLTLSLRRLLPNSARSSALARTRFVFFTFALFTVALAAPLLAFGSEAGPVLRGLAALGIVWLAARHVALYRTRRTLPALIPVDAAALIALAGAIGTEPLLGVFYVGVYFRSLYGQTRYVVANGAVFLLAYAIAGMALQPGAPITAGDIALQGYGLMLSAGVMRIVTSALSREERTRARERLLRETGGALVAARGRDAIYQTGMAAALSALKNDEHARVTIWRGNDGRLQVVAAAGDLAEAVAGKEMDLGMLAPAAAESFRGGDVLRIQPDGPASNRPNLPFRMKLGGALVVPLHTQDGQLGAMVTSTDHALPVEVEDTLRAVASQVALALESDQLTADLHRRQSEERFGSLIRNASDVITVVGADRVVRYQTPSIARVFGYAPEELLGSSIVDLLHPDDKDTAVAFLDRAARLDGGTATCEWRMARRDGAWRRVEVVAGNLLDDDNVQGIVLTSRDITERRALERQLAHQAFHDSLTDLANRDLFRNRVEHALSRPRGDGAAAVLFVDIDDFKNVNDTLGHATGDRMLELVAERLRRCVPPGDTAARLGGDEFAVLLENVDDADDASRVAAEVLSALEQPLVVDERDLPVRASIGIALSGPGVASAEELLRNADIAMYAAKAEGKSRLRLFEPAMYVEALDRVQLHEALSHALVREELTLHYQPVVDLATGSAVGAEALIRWQHPERGLLLPGDFISLAEESGLIIPIGRWVIRDACRQLREWRDAGAVAESFRLSVNLSAGQLTEARLVADVDDALRAHGLEGQSLVVEITESAVMEDFEGAVARLHELRALGVLLALDDFGTGYSSLSYLQRFPLDILKLDRAFTEQLRPAAQESRLPRAIIELGHALGLRIVAEGIEEASQAARLVELGCARGQGFHFARPVPADRLVGVMAQLGERAGVVGAPAA
jgi:diguanylate cyclase (GGDEF)-like protein/PAS domain S-box-containing protein